MMEGLLSISYLVIPLLLVPLSLFYLVSFLGRGRSTSNLPPGRFGWPIMGESLAIGFSGPENFIKSRMLKYSPVVFRTSFLGEKVAVFCGARGNKFLFTNEPKLVSTWWPETVTRTFLLHPDEEEDRMAKVLAFTRSFRFDVLKPDSVRPYAAMMDSEARAHVASHWIPNSVVKVHPLSRKFAFELACRMYIGVVDPDHVKRLWDPFVQVTHGLVAVPIDLPGTTYNRATSAGKKVQDELLGIIRERRKEVEDEGEVVAGQRQDFLAKIIVARDGDGGEFLSEIAICNYLIALFFASFDTISTTITFVFYYLAQLPHIYANVLAEQMEIAKSKGPDELLTSEDIEKMKYSWNVVCEALRLRPPAQGTIREALTDLSYAGFTIPKGWKTYWTVHTTHKDPRYFPEPEKFDPSRFEGTGPPPYTYLPFGGGPHMCPGKENSRLEILALVHNVVTRFRLEMAIPNEKIVFRAFPVPAHGLPIHLHPHQK